jgi:hypothetical protein
MKFFHFETLQHKALECETFVRNMHGKNQKGVCHLTRNKHGDECMQNFEQQGDLSGKKKA